MIVDISQTSRTPKYVDVTATPNVIAIAPNALASSRASKLEGGKKGDYFCIKSRAPSEAVRTMADPRGGRREKVKINENSSSAGAIEKLPGAARGTWV
ncbi:hypothetical protein X777_11613 [Ooceraea biroi]|uniref:Uncharacterized protein n=1 Tax=Ooceraea biroi TaxID=2015173 RepID=A0A026W2B8_OOCBI|nr:hypothetical protein X777_11613 [Ooceraea biroi]